MRSRPRKQIEFCTFACPPVTDDGDAVTVLENAGMNISTWAATIKQINADHTSMPLSDRKEGLPSFAARISIGIHPHNANAPGHCACELSIYRDHRSQDKLSKHPPASLPLFPPAFQHCTYTLTSRFRQTRQGIVDTGSWCHLAELGPPVVPKVELDILPSAGQLLGSLERGVRVGASCSENRETRKDEGASKIFDECQTLTLGEKPPRQVTGGRGWEMEGAHGSWFRPSKKSSKSCGFHSDEERSACHTIS